MDGHSTVDDLAGRLGRWPELAGLAAWLLEAAGPLTVLGASALHVAGPLLSAFAPQQDLDALADLLADPAQVDALRARLERTA